MRRWLAAIDVRDVLAAGGLVLVTIGAWQIYPPAAYVVPGIVLLGAALWRIR